MAIDLGEERQFGTVASQPVREALVTFLWAARPLARGEPPPRRIQEVEAGAARWAWPRVAAADRATRSLRGDLQTFERRTFVASRPLVTPAIILVCVAAFAGMVARRRLRSAPDRLDDGRLGRELRAVCGLRPPALAALHLMFLHFGLIHLLANMYCLATAGPLVERFFGHLGFAGLYLLSGSAGRSPACASSRRASPRARWGRSSGSSAACSGSWPSATATSRRPCSSRCAAAPWRSSATTRSSA